ncbi:MAG: presqualene diphosphate synthase HpnD [Burkholderiaceae bacterium]|nr:presqualene diphosphate synthase HpnD [Burkholderiaceae bacterium]
MTPDEYCRERAASSGSSFYYSFAFLSTQRRRAITALYAFCREVDDVVDDSTDDSLARVRLDWWREEVERLYAGQPQHPVTRALAPHLSDYALERARLLEIIDGMQMDLEQNRYLDFEGLRLYCHRVAGVVGMLAANIFGARRESTSRYAEELGVALQLTNIIRDVGEDARRNRIYLPIEDLQRFGVAAHEILAIRPSERFVELMRFQATRARECHARALSLLEADERRAQRPGVMMAAIYFTLLDEIERDGFRVLTHRTSLTPVRKMWIAWRTWIFGASRSATPH